MADLSSGLIRKYYFDGNADDSISGYNGTVYNAVLTTDRFGNDDSAYSFDGSGDYINTANTGLQGLTSISISCWIYPYSLTNLAGIVYSKGSTNKEIGIQIYSDGKVRFVLGNGSNTIAATSGSGAITANQWNHIVVKWTSSIIPWNLYVYVNANLVATSSTIISSSIQLDDTLKIGWCDNSSFYYFNGKIDDIRIYNRKITDEEISLLFNEINPLSILKPQHHFIL